MDPAPRSPLVPAALGLLGGLLLGPHDGAALLPAPLLLLSALAPRSRPPALAAVLGWLLAFAPPPSAPRPPPTGLPCVSLVRAAVVAAEPQGPSGQSFELELDEPGPEGTGRVGPGAPPARLAVRAPPSLVELLPGDRVEAALRVRALCGPRNPGAPDRRALARTRGVSAEATVEAGLLRLRSRGDGPAAAVARLRSALARRLSAILDAEDAGLARALVLGDRAALTPADQRRFRETGQTHLVAVSGQHVALVLAGVLLTLSRLGLRRRTAALVGLVVVAAYVPLAGAAPSAVRSGLGASLWLLARLLGRQQSGGPLIAAAALAMLVAAPTDLQDAGFVLSFGAVLGIELLAPRLIALLVPEEPRLPGLLPPRRARLRRALAVALAAWLGSAPPAAVLLGQLNVWAAPLSLLAVPLAGLLLALGSLLLLVPLPAAQALAPLFARAADLLRGLLGAAIDAGASNLEIAPPGALWLGASTAALLGVGCGPPRLLRYALLAEGLLLLHAASPRPAPPAPWPEALVLAVGDAPAVLFLVPDGRTALVARGARAGTGTGDRGVARALAALGLPEPTLRLDPHGPLRPGILLDGPWGRLEALLASPPEGAPRAAGDRSPVLRLHAAGGSALLWPTERGPEGLADLALYEGGSPPPDVLLLPGRGLPERLEPPLATLWSGARRVPVAEGGGAGADADARAAAQEGALRVRLAPAPVVEPWSAAGARAPGAYDRARVPAPPAPPPAAVAWVVLALGLFALASARPLGWLRPLGALGAWVLGGAAFAAFGPPGLAALFGPFLVGTLLGRLPGAERDRGRTLTQVVANGLPAGLGSLLAALGAPAAGAALLLGGLSCLGADTCATEVGTRYGGRPRSLLSGRPLAPGESGGVTALGLLASLGGALLAPLAWALSPGGAVPAAVVGLAAAAGVAGALLDSLLGAGVQYRGRDPATGRSTERRRVDGRATERVSGLRLLDNDGVNLVAGLFAAALALALLAR